MITVLKIASCTTCKYWLDCHSIWKEWHALIKSIRHKGLKKFFNSGGTDTRGINSDHEDKLRDQLAALDSATDIADMDVPGWRLHPLKGRDKGRHAIWVSGNWRMTFEFENGDAYVVDYEDYH
jgi:proteic killer suppression protein